MPTAEFDPETRERQRTERGQRSNRRNQEMERQGNPAAPEGGGERQPSIQDLLAIIRQQNVSLTNQATALQQMQAIQQQATNAMTEARTLTEDRRQQMIAAAANVDTAGGIYGYHAGRELTQEERSFHTLIQGLGVNKETADEVFRQGIDGTSALKRLTSEKLKNIIYNMTRNKSPNCPEPHKVFLGAAFEDKLTVLISWIQFQRIIGGTADAAAWNADPNASEKTSERLQYYREIKSSEGTEDISLPNALDSMKKFIAFRDHLRSYLRTKRGAANVPLVYVIRDEDDVTDDDRNGLVGTSPSDRYKNWDEYAIRCTVMNGTHWDSDNTSFWQILSRLVRDGPGWDFIRRFEKIGDGDGRGAYKALVAQAFQVTNVRIIKQEARSALRNLRYGGDTKSWNYERYVRMWLRHIKTLRELNDCPSEETLVTDFVTQITDPRLDQACATVLEEGSAYINDFNRTQMYMNNVLSVATNREKLRLRERKISSMNSNKKERFEGKLEAKEYTAKEWHSMTWNQRNTVRKMRRDAEANNKRKASAVDTADKSSSKKDAGSQFGSNAHNGKKKQKAKGGDESQ